jgi:hypothetical protein
MLKTLIDWGRTWFDRSYTHTEEEHLVELWLGRGWIIAGVYSSILEATAAFKRLAAKNPGDRLRISSTKVVYRVLHVEKHEYRMA